MVGLDEAAEQGKDADLESEKEGVAAADSQANNQAVEEEKKETYPQVEEEESKVLPEEEEEKKEEAKVPFTEEQRSNPDFRKIYRRYYHDTGK